MPNLHSSNTALPGRRPAGPSCHGGASSMLRQGVGAALRRAAPPRMTAWRDAHGIPAAHGAIEHVLAWPLASAAR